jgi:hypothetical protein
VDDLQGFSHVLSKDFPAITQLEDTKKLTMKMPPWFDGGDGESEVLKP